MLRRERIDVMLEQADLLLRGISDGVTVQDTSGNLLYVNDMAARMSGFPDAQTMRTTPVAEIIARFEMLDENGAPLDVTRLPGRRALAGHKPEPLIVGVRDRTSGDVTWSLLRADAICDNEGKPVLAVNVFHDATATQRHKQASRLLAKATASLASSLEYETTLAAVAEALIPDLADWCIVELLDEGGGASSPDRRTVAVAHADLAQIELAGRIRAASPAPAVAGASPSDSSIKSPVARALELGEPFFHREITEAHRAEYARERTHLALLSDSLDLRSVMCVPIVAAGLVEGAIILVSAESRRRFDEHDLELAQELGRRAGTAIGHARAYQAAKDAVSARDEFLSIAGHELRTPLATLVLQLESLRRLLVTTSVGVGISGSAVSASERIERTLVQANRLSRLVDELLDVTLVTYGRLVLETEEMDLAELVRDVGARFVDEAARASSTLTVNAPGTCRGEWDGRRLDRVMSNLISNAIKYGEGRPIDVVCTRMHNEENEENEDGLEHDRVRIDVIDRGSGVPPNEVDRIFDRFERGASSTRRRGLGLGLWIAREIVVAHGGSIRVVSPTSAESSAGSENPNRGATFTVELPGCAPEPHSPTSPA